MIPTRYWKPFLEEDFRTRVLFEEAISELVGRPITLRFHDEHSVTVAQRAIVDLFRTSMTDKQSWDALNSLLGFYDLKPMTEEFFHRYFSEDATKSPQSLAGAVRRFQTEAIRLFSTFGEAYERLNEPGHLTNHLKPLSHQIRLRKLDAQSVSNLVKVHWADFDMYGEDQRVPDGDERSRYRRWLDAIRVKEPAPPIDPDVRAHVERILVAVAVRFEGRASTGVLNGMLVARSIDRCARLVAALLRNDQELELVDDDHNYRLIEKSTGSIIRVISRHSLVVNAFTTFYSERTPT